MHRLIFGHSFAEVVALILLPGLAFYILNKKKADASGSSTAPTGTNSDASSSSNAPSGNFYDVFLSFSGQDTRHGFTDHLYRGLVDARINTFRDNDKLRRGEEMGDAFSTAIKNSKILIPILSVNYGTSSWCLNELVQIMECKKNNKETIVLPIFYQVKPSDVRHQIGNFGVGFHDREKRLLERSGFDSRILEKWKGALKKVSSLQGHNAKGPEGELVQSVVREVLSKLIAKFELDIPKNLIGIDSQVEEVMKFVANNSCATLFVGIHGMGGIGKTTLAKTIYNRLLNQFECHSFIADIREKYQNGVEHLHNQLFCDILKTENLVQNRDEGIKLLSSDFKGQKVLILLDDVDADVHLEDLAGNHDWFSSGSVIIITTRDKSILDNACMDHTHDQQVLDKDSSLILFSRHAFRKNSPPSEFEKLADKVVSTTGRLPLSLKVLGSFLRNKTRGVWKDTIKKLKNVPHKDVQKKLRISYDALDYGQQQIFLDIACFFIGTDYRIASYLWDACDWYPNEGIVVLRLMSLIKVGENHELSMHDQLQDLGREIVREKGKREPRKCSRLWHSKEALKVLKEDEGTKMIEAIHLSKDSPVGLDLTGEQFKKLRNLRFLNANGVNFKGDFKNAIKKLKWLQWENCPSTFEANNFHAEELQVLTLDLCRSKTLDQWQGWSFITMAKNLKYLNLLGGASLKETSFLSTFENLEVLILKNCYSIEQIDSSIGNMKSLVQLDLLGCNNLKGLPIEVGKLEALEQLDLCYCLQVSSLPDNIGALQNLEKLNMCWTKIKELSNGIHNLYSLQRLDLCFCKELQSPSALPSSLTYLGITCQSGTLPSLSNLTHLKELRLYECESLECFGEHPPYGLEILDINRCKRLKTLDVSLFTHLRTLSTKDCTNLLKIRGLDKLKYLESLDISFCNSIERLDLSESKGLKRLIALECGKVEIQGLERLELLRVRRISRCKSLERLDLSESKGLKKLIAPECKISVENQELQRRELSRERRDYERRKTKRL